MSRIVYLGQNTSYAEVFTLQTNLLKMRQENQIEDTLLFLEHERVITIGNSGKETNVLVPQKFLEQQGFKVQKINRGGDVTYHGPGQLVGYFIFNIYDHGEGVRDFFYKLEEIFVRNLKDYYGIEAGRETEYPGVWVGLEKITALGCAIKRGVSMHGFGFNVNTNLDDFRVITPCGIIDRSVTSLEKILGQPQDMEIVRANLQKTIEDVFDIKFKEETLENLNKEVQLWKKENQIG